MAAPDAGPIPSIGHSPEAGGGAVTHESLQTASVLMIGRDPQLMSYRSAVLATAKLSVQNASPTQAQTILQNGADYDVVILSHTLDPTEILELEKTVRSRKPGAKLLLMLGPGDVPPDCVAFDATMHGLDGPSAFIHTVRRLAGHSA